ncbi:MULTISPECIES: EcsC family protein [Clostridium]|uniref:EcsC family protein n=1 Tax=Clostridium cibarium TaxID=2762247 RepID=A0ABR8PVF4_9CLOT|nr:MULTISPECIES: EcsC family protein [Clostridium]MBD7912134.1 EcsC family protein [Clostridium cibarium]
MNKILNKQIKKLNKEEKKILDKKENKLIKEKINPLVEKVEAKIPKKLKSTLDVAFYNGFKIVLNKGTKYIEKMYDKEKIQLEHDINNYSMQKRINKKSIKLIDKKARKSNLLNSTISTLEGGTLGILGIGLPDIPLFIVMILKTIYEISLSYGFNYEREEEKVYILNLITVALLKGELKDEYNSKLDELAKKIDLDLNINYIMDDEIKKASDSLSQGMVTAKFIQGIPLVGAIGGVTNYVVINKISKFAALKYKKRYLSKILNE